MSRKTKLLWGGLVLIVMLCACCLGMLIGRLLEDRSTPTRPAALAPTGPAITATPLIVVVTATPGPSGTPRPTHTPAVIVVTGTPQPTDPLLPAPTPTRVPALQPTAGAADLQALTAYAEAVKPILDEGLATAARDGAILEVSQQNPNALCGSELNPHPVLVADAALMDNLVRSLEWIAPPAEAANTVHKPLMESACLWGDALDNINLSCQTSDPAGQGLLRLGATLQLGGSLLNFRIASDNFWRLVIVNGLEAIVGPPPP